MSTQNDQGVIPGLASALLFWGRDRDRFQRVFRPLGKVVLL
jgi:hypothetical protein